MDFAEFMEIMRITGEQLSEFLGMDVSRFGRTFIVSFIILLILAKISFKIFDRTMFDRSDPSNVRRLPIDLGLEVKRMLFPVLWFALYTFARPIVLKGFSNDSDFSIMRLLRESGIPISLGQLYFIINVIAPLIISVPLIITAIRCARTGKYDLRRFLALVPFVAILMTAIGTAVAGIIYILLQFGDIETNIFVQIFALALSLVLLLVGFITNVSFIIWIIPQGIFNIFAGARKQREEDERKIEEFRKARRSGGSSSTGGRSYDKPAKEKAVFPETLRINGEAHHKIWASDEQAEYRNSRTGETVRIWYTDLPDYD